MDYYVLWKKMGIAAQSIIACGKAINIRVASNSMRPCLKENDIVTIVPAQKTQIKPGDIILRLQEGKGSLMIHRCLLVIKKDHNKFFLTKGDAVFKTDVIVDKSFILGKANIKETLFQKMYFRCLQYLLLPLFVVNMVLFRRKRRMKWLLILGRL